MLELARVSGLKFGNDACGKHLAQFDQVANYDSVSAQRDRWITNPAERTAILHTTPGALYRFDFSATTARG